MPIVYLAYKRKPWIVKYREPWSGHPRQRSFLAEDDAREFEAATVALYERERAIVRNTKRRRSATKPSGVTVGELLERYLDSLTNPTTRASNDYHLRLFLDIYGQRKAHCITLDDIAAFMSLQTQRGVGQSTIGRRLRIVRAGYNWAVKWRLLPASPLASLRLSNPQPQTPAPPSLHEAKMIYKAAAPHIQRVLVLGITTGPRIGPSELFRLRWSDIDTSAGSLRMPNAHKGARDESRDVPLRKDIMRLMRRWETEDKARDCPYVIHYRGKPVRKIGHAWHSALRRAGITRRIRPYDLRHGFASLSLDYNADIKSIMEVMGHTNEQMILRYYRHTSAEQRRRAVNAAPSLGLD